jgi:hypothetical protein
MIALAGHTYEDNTACIICRHVMDGAPVLQFVFDIDGEVQFLCGAARHDKRDARVVGLDEVDHRQNGLDSLPDMPLGTQASRMSTKGRWEVTPLD